jgi:hypothetical protein
MRLYYNTVSKLLLECLQKLMGASKNTSVIPAKAGIP